MATETIGKYQLHLIALEASQNGWDPYVSILKFDENAQDFICLLEKYPAANEALATYEEAIEQARQIGNALIASGRFDYAHTRQPGGRPGMPSGITQQQVP